MIKIKILSYIFILLLPNLLSSIKNNIIINVNYLHIKYDNVFMFDIRK